MAEGGELDPFVLVVEGSIPNEDIGRILRGSGYRPADGPTHSHRRMDRPARAQSLGCYGSRHMCDIRWHSRHAGNPTGCMRLADYLGWNWRSHSGLPIVNVPGCPIQPDNFMEALSYLLYQAAGMSPMIRSMTSSGQLGCSAKRFTRDARGVEKYIFRENF